MKKPKHRLRGSKSKKNYNVGNEGINFNFQILQNQNVDPDLYRNHWQCIGKELTGKHNQNMDYWALDLNSNVGNEGIIFNFQILQNRNADPYLYRNHWQCIGKELIGKQNQNPGYSRPYKTKMHLIIGSILKPKSICQNAGKGPVVPLPNSL